MPFVTQYDNYRIFKRSKRLKGRPKWQDEVPEEKYRRDTYRIAAKHQAAFSRAFLKAVRDVLPDKMPNDFKVAFDEGSSVNAINSLPLFNEASPEQSEVWRKFGKSLQEAYVKILQESGEDSMRETNKKFDTKLKFGVGEIEKAREDVREAALGIVVPINPYSLKWMEDRSLELVTQGITLQQKQVIQDTLMNAFEQGIRADSTYKEIKANIGLTAREAKAVQNRQLLLESQEIPKPQITKLVEKYRQQLLKKRAERIARTETIMANARGRHDAWKLAEESGSLPVVERVWVAAPPSPNPNRPCAICLDLDNKTAAVGGTYDSLIGPVEGPPAHPSCRCSETLRKREE